MEPIIKGDCLEIADILGKNYSYQSCWSSTEAFSRYVKSLDRNKAWSDSGWEGGKDFTGSKTMEEALHLADGHWDEGADKVQRMVDLIHANRPSRKYPKKYGITGALPSIPRAVSGNILNMLQLETGKNKRRPVITLISNMCVNWTVDKNVLSNKSAALTAVIDQIESAGYSVEVISTAITGGNRRSDDRKYMAATSVMAKTSDQPVDIKRLAFALGHPSMFRRMVFSDWGTEPSARTGLGQGLGYVNDPQPNGSEELAAKYIYKIPPTEGSSALYETDNKAMTLGLDHMIASLMKQKCPCFSTWQFSKEYKEYCEKAKKKSIISNDDDDDDF